MRTEQRTEVRTEYVCETCGAVYKKRKDAEDCERRHEEERLAGEFAKMHPARLQVGDIVRFMYRTLRVASVSPECCCGACDWCYELVCGTDMYRLFDKGYGDLFNGQPGRKVMTAGEARELYEKLDRQLKDAHGISLCEFVAAAGRQGGQDDGE